MMVREPERSDAERPTDAIDYTPRSYSPRETIITVLKLSAVVGMLGGLLWLVDVLVAG